MIVDEIYKQREKEQERKTKAREHLGCSEIGKSCERALFYSFRWFKKKKHSGRTLRLFETGTLEENRLAVDLARIGAKVILVDPKTKRQFSFRDNSGHFGGEIDGIVKNLPLEKGEKTTEWSILEFKTHSEKNFKKLSKEGVKKAFPIHYAQVVCYLYLSKLKTAIYLAVNKNTDELYFEEIKEDSRQAIALIDKANRVIFSEVIPARISETPDWHECKVCDFFTVCHGKEDIDRNCRTCGQCSFKQEGKAVCEFTSRELNLAAQLNGCGSYTPFSLKIEERVEAIKSSKNCVKNINEVFPKTTGKEKVLK